MYSAMAVRSNYLPGLTGIAVGPEGGPPRTHRAIQLSVCGVLDSGKLESSILHSHCHHLPRIKGSKRSEKAAY
jgi:hypothetical protein